MPRETSHEPSDDALVAYARVAQVFLGGEYDLNPVDMATVLSLALANTVAEASQAGIADETLVQKTTRAVENMVEHRLKHPPRRGELRELIEQYRGKVKVN